VIVLLLYQLVIISIQVQCLATEPATTAINTNDIGITKH